ncbi:hypothetical protein [Paenibacillus sp. GbtcB18]|uniref:hypothetical protein n=1 Tax=Paenibacillus sp. GbtcB18 TaxID=2824763 RepID=UPI001C2F728B|nr:hypothetical protein [Paenibacillus sp. GbtcB18]
MRNPPVERRVLSFEQVRGLGAGAVQASSHRELFVPEVDRAGDAAAEQSRSGGGLHPTLTKSSSILNAALT